MVTDMRVKEIMTTPVVCVEPEAPLKKVVGILDSNSISGLPVVDDKNRVVGIISERDLLKYTRWIIGRPLTNLGEILEHESSCVSSQRGLDIVRLVADTTAGALMTGQVITVREDAPVSEAVKAMNKHDINRVPVVDARGKLKGIVTRADMMKMLEQWAEDTER